MKTDNRYTPRRIARGIWFRITNKLIPWVRRKISEVVVQAPFATMNSHVGARDMVLAKFRPFGTGAEIGVFRGTMARRILDWAMPEKLYLIDPWENTDDPSLAYSMYGSRSPVDMNEVYVQVASDFAAEIEAGQVEICRATSEVALAALPDASLDYVYIDGDHRYEGVTSDLELSWTKLRPGGVIALDDNHKVGWWKDGVTRAVNEFAGRHSRDITIEFALRGQVLLRKDGGGD